MRLEGNDGDVAAGLARQIAADREDVRVAAVHSVEIADGQHRPRGQSAQALQTFQYAHARGAHGGIVSADSGRVRCG